MRPITTNLLWLLLVFASGVTIGAVGHRYFQEDPVSARAPQRPSRDELRRGFLENLRTRVGVSEDQISRIIEILDRGRANADEHKAAMDREIRHMQEAVAAEIRAVLTPEQVVRYEQWREERRREREKLDEERKRAEGR
jgi:hypothetical protein